jgi:DNA modification methylase
MKTAKTKQNLVQAEAENIVDFLTFAARKAKCDNVDQFFRKGDLSTTSDLFEIGKYFLSHAMGCDEDDFLPHLRNREVACFVPQSETYYPWALFVVPTKCEDLAEFFDHHGRDYLLSAESGKKDFAVVTNLKTISVFDFKHYIEDFEVSLIELYDSCISKERNKSSDSWQAFLREFGPEKVKEKKKTRRKEVINYQRPKESSPELQYVKRFGHMPNFEIPVGYDGKNFRETFKTKDDLPFLSTETVDWDGKARKLENKLVWGDNLAVMRALPSDSLDLIYIDPPFFSGRDYNCIFGDDDEVRSFKDIWDGGLPTYLAWLNARIWEMKRLLKPTGSIFVHLDWHAAHYVKCELDKIFGYDNFVNEIAWCYNVGGKGRRTFARKHDTILFYSKTEDYFFDGKAVGLKRETGTKSFGGKMGVDENGRPYQDKLAKGGKYYRYYLDEPKIPEDWWTDINSIQSQSAERIGYPTQKPEELLRRIIMSACPEGGTVADFFSGGGTTAAVAEKLGRKWLGVDISRIAVSVARDRVLGAYESETGIKALSGKPAYGFSLDYHGVYERDQVRDLEPKSYTTFVLKCFQATPKSQGDYIHGFKEDRAIYVAPPKANLKNHQIEGFCADLADRKIQNGIILAWNISKEAEKYVAELRKGASGIDIQIVQIKLIDIDSNEFKGDNIRFINKPAALIRKTHKAGLAWHFDATASCGANGSDIHYYQWDFNFKGRFSPSTKPNFKSDGGCGKSLGDHRRIAHTFPAEGTFKIALRVFDKSGAEAMHVIEMSVTKKGEKAA